MSIPEYRDVGSLDVVAQLDPQQLKSKSVIVTGGMFATGRTYLLISRLKVISGASGLGKAYVEAFVKAGLVTLIPPLLYERAYGSDISPRAVHSLQSPTTTTLQEKLLRRSFRRGYL